MMHELRIPRRLAVFLIASLISAQWGPADSHQQFAELVPLPLSEQLSTMREPLPIDTLIEAALAFSGSVEPASKAAREKLITHIRRFRETVSSVSGEAELGEKALSYLHANLLSSYSVLQTRVDTAIETGSYNCVSSAVLYMIFARSVGLSVGGIRTPDHAFCTVWVNGAPVDVETTNPYGFNPGSRKEFTDTFGKVTGYTYVPPTNYRDRRSIGEKELLALILYNRVSEYGESRSYRDAVGPAVNAYALLGDDEMRRILTIALSNYVTWLGMRREYPLASRFIEEARATFGTDVDLDRPRSEIEHNWIVSLLESGDIDQAQALLTEPSTRAALGESDWSDLSVYAVQAQAESAARSDNFLLAAEIVEGGLRRLGSGTALLKSFEAYVHNAFALLYNGRKFADAKNVLEKGLETYPESQVFSQDLASVKRVLKQ